MQWEIIYSLNEELLSQLPRHFPPSHPHAPPRATMKTRRLFIHSWSVDNNLHINGNIYCDKKIRGKGDVGSNMLIFQKTHGARL